MRCIAMSNNAILGVGAADPVSLTSVVLPGERICGN
jgi:hypothetical protein